MNRKKNIAKTTLTHKLRFTYTLFKGQSEKFLTLAISRFLYLSKPCFLKVYHSEIFITLFLLYQTFMSKRTILQKSFFILRGKNGNTKQLN